jgi:hypothetical protein
MPYHSLFGHSVWAYSAIFLIRIAGVPHLTVESIWYYFHLCSCVTISSFYIFSIFPPISMPESNLFLPSHSNHIPSPLLYFLIALGLCALSHFLFFLFFIFIFRKAPLPPNIKKGEWVWVCTASAIFKRWYYHGWRFHSCEKPANTNHEPPEWL